jgi:hypothetical protein
MRSFTIESVTRPNGSRINYTGGRFESDSINAPDSVARKMFTKASTKNTKSLTIVFRETTQGSTGKIFKKRVTRFKDPVEVNHGGVMVTHEYTTKVKSLGITH